MMYVNHPFLKAGVSLAKSDDKPPRIKSDEETKREYENDSCDTGNYDDLEIDVDDLDIDWEAILNE